MGVRRRVLLAARPARRHRGSGD